MHRLLAGALGACASALVLGACHLVVGVEERSASERSTPDDAAADGPDGSPLAPGPEPPSFGDGGCDPAKPFGSPILVPGINSTAGELSATLSDDELEIFLVTTRESDVYGVYRAVRSELNESFSPPTPVAELSTLHSSPLGVSLSSDGLALYVSAGEPPERDIHRVTRSARGAPFGASQRVAFAASTGVWEDHPFVTKDGDLFFSVYGSGADRDLFFTPKGATKAVPLDDVNTSAHESWPVESWDGRRLYFLRERGEQLDILEMKRAPDRRFEAPGTVLALPGAGRRYPVWISPNDCRLYFVMETRGAADGNTGGADVYVARRPF
jgi:hypothetical protein